MFFRYDGEYFLSDIKEVTKRMKSKSKERKQMRYYFYMKWAIELRKAAFDIEKDNDNPCYTYPKIILNVLREICSRKYYWRDRRGIHFFDKLYCSSTKTV